jgi:hypothetical protein
LFLRRQSEERSTAVFALLMLGLFVAVGIAAILGWTADTRDDAQKLWPLEPARAKAPIPAAHGRVPDTRWDAALQPAVETITRQRMTR